MSQDLLHEIIAKFKIILREGIEFEKDELKDIANLNFLYNSKKPKVIESSTFPTEQKFQTLTAILIKAYKKTHQNVNSTAISSGKLQEDDLISNINDSPQFYVDSNITENKSFQNNAKVEVQRSIKIHENVNDSEDEEEDGATYYPMKKSMFDAARSYFFDTEYYFFFNDVTDYELQFTPNDVKGKELLVKLKDLKVVPIEEENLETLSALLSKHTKIIRHEEKMLLVGPTNEVMSILKKENSNMEKTFPISKHKDSEDTLGTRIHGGARPKEPIVKKELEHSTGYRYVHHVDDYTPVYIGSTGLEIHVCNADITNLRVDCIVNAANKHLRHGGGVARVISKAAGYRLQDECERYIAEYDSVQVTGVFVSSGGDLPAKHVIHAVGPRWDDYVDKNKCTSHLRRTVLTCLLEATKLNMSTIALPSISAALFRVPTNLCAEAYMHAVKSYDAIVQKMNLDALRQIQFVDINPMMVDTIHQHFATLWHTEILRKFYEEDLKFAEFYMHKQSQATQISRDNILKQDYRVKPDESVASSHINKIGHEKYKSGESKHASSRKQADVKTTEYSLHLEQVELNASYKHAFDIKPDLVIIVGDPFNKLSGLSGFKATDLKKIILDESINNVQIFESTMKGKKPIHVLQLSIDEFNHDNLQKSFNNLGPALRLLKDKLTSLVITSKFLYPETSKNVADPKTVGKFAQFVYDFATEKAVSLVTVTASEDVLPHIIKVFQSRQTAKEAHKADPDRQRNASPKNKQQCKSSNEKPRNVSPKHVPQTRVGNEKPPDSAHKADPVRQRNASPKNKQQRKSSNEKPQKVSPKQVPQTRVGNEKPPGSGKKQRK